MNPILTSYYVVGSSFGFVDATVLTSAIWIAIQIVSPVRNGWPVSKF